jgi:hypothetical protein
MRNALFILLVSGMSAVTAKAATDVQPVSIYATPSVSVVDDTSDLLPVRGRDLPLTAPTVQGTNQAAPQSSVVEAIPTPTAFQAGVVLLLALACGRMLRKLRLV